MSRVAPAAGRRAFTLVEVVVALLLLAVGVAVALGILQGRTGMAAATAALLEQPAALRALELALDLEGADALREELREGSGWRACWMEMTPEGPLWRITATGTVRNPGSFIHVAVLKPEGVLPEEGPLRLRVRLGWVDAQGDGEDFEALRRRAGSPGSPLDVPILIKR